MAVKLRLRRLGRTHLAYYQIVAADSRFPRDGRFLEKVGQYDPNLQFNGVQLDHDLALKWLHNGAQPTDTVRSILSKEGVMLKYHLAKSGKTPEQIEAAYQAWKQTADVKLSRKIDEVNQAKEKEKEARLVQERKTRESRAASLAAKRSAAPAE